MNPNKPMDFLYTVRVQPAGKVKTIPNYKMGEVIKELELDPEKESEFPDWKKPLKGVYYTWRIRGEERIQEIIQKPTPLIPAKAICSSCYRSSSPSKLVRHKTDCNQALEPHLLLFNEEYLNKLNPKEKSRVHELNKLGGELYFTEIFKLPNRERNKFKTGKVQLPWFTFLVGKKLVKAKLYPNDSTFEIQKISAELVDKAVNVIGNFFMNFLNSEFGNIVNIMDYVLVINMIETRIPIPKGMKINKSKNDWNNFVNGPIKKIIKDDKISPSKASFITTDKKKLTVKLETNYVFVSLNHGTIKECESGVTSKNCIINKDSLMPYIEFTINNVMNTFLEGFSRAPSKRLQKVFNSYTPRSVFTTKSSQSSTCEYTTAPGNVSKSRTHPYEFFGKCPPTQIFSWEGTDDLTATQISKLGGKKRYFPKCEAINALDLKLPTVEMTKDELENSIIISESKPYKKPFKNSHWMEKFLNGNKTEMQPRNVESWTGSGDNNFVIKMSEDPDSGIYKHGKQSERFHGNNEMILDSRKWPGLLKLDDSQIEKFVDCALKQMRIIDPAEQKMNLFTVLPLYYILPFDGELYNIPVSSVFVKIYITTTLKDNIEKSCATILEIDSNVLYRDIPVNVTNPYFNHKIEVNGEFVKTEPTDFEIYAFLNSKTIFPIFDSKPPFEFKVGSKLSIKNIEKTTGEKEIIVDKENLKLRIAFENPTYIQNHLTKQVTMDFYYDGKQLTYKSEDVSLEDKEIVQNYNKELVVDSENKKLSETVKKFYSNYDSIKYESKVLGKKSKAKKGWYRFRFAWFKTDDPRYDDTELFYQATKMGTKLVPEFILEPIKKLENTPRDSYLETWNKFYRIVITFSDFYSNYYTN